MAHSHSTLGFSSNTPELLEKLHQVLEAKGYQPLPVFYVVIEGQEKDASTVCFFKNQQTADDFNKCIFKGGNGLTSFKNPGQQKPTQEQSKNPKLSTYQDKGTHVIYLAPIDIGKLMPGESVSNSLIGKQYTPPLKIKGTATLVPTPGAEKVRAEQLMKDIEAHQIFIRMIASAWTYQNGTFKADSDFEFNIGMIANPEKLQWKRRYQFRGNFKGDVSLTLNKRSPATKKVKQVTYVDDKTFKSTKAAKYQTHTPKFACSVLSTAPAAMGAHSDAKVGFLFHENELAKKMVDKDGQQVEEYSWVGNANTNAHRHVSDTMAFADYDSPHASVSEIKRIQRDAVLAKKTINHPEHLFRMPKRKVRGLCIREKTDSATLLFLLKTMYELRKAFEQDFNVPLLHLPVGKDSQGNWLSMSYIDYPQRLKAINEILNQNAADRNNPKPEYQLLEQNKFELIKNVVRDAYLEGLSDREPGFSELLTFCKDKEITIEKPSDHVSWTKEQAEEFKNKNIEQFNLFLKKMSLNKQLTAFFQAVFLIEHHQAFFLDAIKKYLVEKTKWIRQNTAPTTTAPTTTAANAMMTTTASSSASTSSSSTSSASSTLDLLQHKLAVEQQEDTLAAAEQLYYFYLKKGKYGSARKVVFCLAKNEDHNIHWRDQKTKEEVLGLLFAVCARVKSSVSSRLIKNVYTLLTSAQALSIEAISIFRDGIEKEFKLKDESLVSMLYARFFEVTYEVWKDDKNLFAPILSSLFSLQADFFVWVQFRQSSFANLAQLFQSPKKVFTIWAERSEDFSKGVCTFPIRLDFLTRFLFCFSQDANPDEKFIKLFLGKPQSTGLFAWIANCYQSNPDEFLKQVKPLRLPKQIWRDIFMPWLDFFSQNPTNQGQCKGITDLLFEKVPLDQIVEMSAQSSRVFLWKSFSDYIIPNLEAWLKQLEGESDQEVQKSFSNGVNELLQSKVVYRDEKDQRALVSIIMNHFSFFEKHCFFKLKELLMSRISHFQNKITNSPDGQEIVSELQFCVKLFTQNIFIQEKDLFLTGLRYLSLLFSACDMSDDIHAQWIELYGIDLFKKRLKLFMEEKNSMKEILDLSFVSRDKQYCFVCPLVHLYLSTTSNPPSSMNRLEIAWKWMLWALKQPDSRFSKQIPELFKSSSYIKIKDIQYTFSNQGIQAYFIKMINGCLDDVVIQATIATHSSAVQTEDALTAEQLFTLISLLPESMRNSLVRNTFDEKQLTKFLNQARDMVYAKLIGGEAKTNPSLFSWVIEKDDVNHIASLDNSNSLCSQLLSRGMISEFDCLITKKTPVFKESSSLENAIFILLSKLNPLLAAKLLEKVSSNAIPFTMDQGLGLIQKAILQFDFVLVEGIIKRTDFLVLPEEKRAYKVLETLIFREAYQAAELLASKIQFNLSYFTFGIEAKTQENILHVLAKNTSNPHATKLLPYFYQKAGRRETKHMDNQGNTFVDYALLYQNQPLIQLIQDLPLGELSEREQHRLLAYYAIHKCWEPLERMLEAIKKNASVVNVDCLLEPKFGPGNTTCNFLTTLIHERKWDLLAILLPLIQSFSAESDKNLKSVLPNLLSYAKNNLTVLSLCCSERLLRFWNQQDLLKLFLLAVENNFLDLLKPFLALPEFNMIQAAAHSAQKHEVIHAWRQIHASQKYPGFLELEIKKTFSEKSLLQIDGWFFYLIKNLFEIKRPDLINDIFKDNVCIRNQRVELFLFSLKQSHFQFCLNMIPYLGRLNSDEAHRVLRKLLKRGSQAVGRNQSELKNCTSSFFEAHQESILLFTLFEEISSDECVFLLKSVNLDEKKSCLWINRICDSVKNILGLSSSDSYSKILKAWIVLHYYHESLPVSTLSNAIDGFPILSSESPGYENYFIPTILFYLKNYFLNLPATEQKNNLFLSKLISVLTFYLQQKYVNFEVITPIFEALFSIKHVFSIPDSAIVSQFFKNNPGALYHTINHSAPLSLGLVYYACNYEANVVIQIPQYRQSVFELVLEKGDLDSLSCMLQFSDLRSLSTDEVKRMIALLCDINSDVDDKQKDSSFFNVVNALENNKSFSLELKMQILIIQFMNHLNQLQTLKTVMAFYDLLKKYHNDKAGPNLKHFFFYREESIFAVSMQGFGKVPGHLIVLIKAIKNRILEILANSSNSIMKIASEDFGFNHDTSTWSNVSVTQSSLPSSTSTSTSTSTSNWLDSGREDLNQQAETELFVKIKQLLGEKRSFLASATAQSQDIFNKLMSQNASDQAEGKTLLQSEQRKLERELSRFGYQVAPVTTANPQHPLKTTTSTSTNQGKESAPRKKRAVSFDGMMVVPQKSSQQSSGKAETTVNVSDGKKKPGKKM